VTRGSALVGGSYGGGYQFVGAFREIADKHKQVFDALAPQITWNDLKSFARPVGCSQDRVGHGLDAAGANSLPQSVLQGFAESAVMGTWSDGSVPGMVNLDRLREERPEVAGVAGPSHRLPVLFGQGITTSYSRSTRA